MNKKKYTIVQILPALNTGGVERGVVEISKALIDHDFRSIVVSSGGHMVPQLKRNGTIHNEHDVQTKNPFKWRKILLMKNRNYKNEPFGESDRTRFFFGNGLMEGRT